MERSPDQLLLLPSGEASHGLIDKGDPALGIEPADPLAGSVEDVV